MKAWKPIAALTTGALALPGFALGGADMGGTAVCNEAENSHRGGYVITQTDDPNPPAFLRGEQMRVGSAKASTGLVRAATVSPAKVVCSGTGGGGDDGGGGGDDGPTT